MRYRFDDHTLDTDTLELLAGATAIDVEPQVFSILAYLVEHRERVVPKEELLDRVWGDRFVSESALTTRIKQARQAVGDSGQRQHVIKTLHGRGYRFVAEVREGEVGHTPRAPSPPLHAATTTIPRTRYAAGDGASIAYQTFGDGPDVVLIAGFATNVEVQWEHPAIAAFLRRLGSFSSVTVLDKRGVGLSDRMPHDNPPSLETRADDLRTVMDAVGIEHATILGSSEGGSLAIVFTASHPERVDRLILHATWAGSPWPRERDQEDLEAINRAWGTGAIYAALGPSLAVMPPGRTFLARYERQSGTPRVAQSLRELITKTDVSTVAPAISVPTLILHRRDDDRIAFHKAEELAQLIPQARLVALQGIDHYLFSGDVGPLLDEIEKFVSGSQPRAAADENVLATVLFVDIVDSSATARKMGDAQWSALLDRFHSLAREVLGRYRGVLVKSTGDGVMATFDGPGRGVQAAGALRDLIAPLGLRIRAGLHTAEIQRRGDDIAGIGVHIASRVAGAAGPGEVWVSRTVTDLVAGTGLAFAERGPHELKGLEQPWQLYAALI